MTGLATIVDLQTLAKVIAYSVIAGAGISATVALAVSAVAGTTEARRNHRTAASVTYAAIAIMTIAATIAAMLVAILVMTGKG